MEHHFGYAAGLEDLHGGKGARAVGKSVNQAGHLPVNRGPIRGGGAGETGGMSHGGQVQNQVRRTAERGMHHHGVADGGVRKDVAHTQAAGFERQHRARRAAGHIQPYGMAGRREGGVWQRHPQGFGHHLRSRGSAQELAATAGCSAGPAEVFGGSFERDLLVREARAHALHAGGIFPFFRQKGDAAGDQHAGQIMHSRKRHHHGGQALVAGSYADHAAAGGE